MEIVRGACGFNGAVMAPTMDRGGEAAKASGASAAPRDPSLGPRDGQKEGRGASTRSAVEKTGKNMPWYAREAAEGASGAGAAWEERWERAPVGAHVEVGACIVRVDVQAKTVAQATSGEGHAAGTMIVHAMVPEAHTGGDGRWCYVNDGMVRAMAVDAAAVRRIARFPAGFYVRLACIVKRATTALDHLEGQVGRVIGVVNRALEGEPGDTAGDTYVRPAVDEDVDGDFDFDRARVRFGDRVYSIPVKYLMDGATIFSPGDICWYDGPIGGASSLVPGQVCVVSKSEAMPDAQVHSVTVVCGDTGDTHHVATYFLRRADIGIGSIVRARPRPIGGGGGDGGDDGEAGEESEESAGRGGRYGKVRGGCSDVGVVTSVAVRLNSVWVTVPDAGDFRFDAFELECVSPWRVGQSVVTLDALVSMNRTLPSLSWQAPDGTIMLSTGALARVVIGTGASHGARGSGGASGQHGGTVCFDVARVGRDAREIDHVGPSTQGGEDEDEDEEGDAQRRANGVVAQARGIAVIEPVEHDVMAEEGWTPWDDTPTNLNTLQDPFIGRTDLEGRVCVGRDATGALLLVEMAEAALWCGDAGRSRRRWGAPNVVNSGGGFSFGRANSSTNEPDKPSTFVPCVTPFTTAYDDVLVRHLALQAGRAFEHGSQIGILGLCWRRHVHDG